MSDLDAGRLSWAGLLAHWIDFARAARALPPSESAPWRSAVPAIIDLQAVTFALGDLTRLAPSERPFARDQAEHLIHRSAQTIADAWRAEPRPPAVVEVIDDARLALRASVFAGAEELVWEGPDAAVVPTLPVTGDRGTLAVMRPGTIVMRGEPVAWWVDYDEAALPAALPACARRRPPLPHQVYRQTDERGVIVRDVVAPILADPPPGQPLLVLHREQGRTLDTAVADPSAWERQQRVAWPAGVLALPVEVSDTP
ncbi:MAG: hypothetical protein HKN62_17630 [Phycisphaerales bacterium]|nr:hypothetical protein [Phycisphaerales bacterium]